MVREKEISALRRTISLLLVEDNADFAFVIQRDLSSVSQIQFNVKHVEALSQAIDYLKGHTVDVVLLDLGLPDSSGLETFLRLHDQAANIPTVALTGSEDADLALSLAQSGAQDYLVKGDFSRDMLFRSILYSIERGELHKEMERLATYPELNPAPILEVSHSEGVTYQNPAAQKLFPEIKQLGWEHPLLNPLKGLSDASFRETETVIREIELQNRVFRERIHRTRVSGVIRIYISDITEQKNIEKLKDEFFHHVNHELRNPITIVGNALELLSEQLKNGSKADQEKLIRIALNSLSHLTNMVGDLIDSTRLQTGKFSVNFRRAKVPQILIDIQGAFKNLAAQKKVAVSIEFDPDLPPAFMDAVRFRQIVTNLTDNALKFTPSGGQIVIRARKNIDPPGFIQVSVKDSGPGMSEQESGKIFDRMYQADTFTSIKKKGLGLGLFICKQLVKLHQGRIWVESVKGHGSTFFFTVPVFSLPKILFPAVREILGRKDSCALFQAKLAAPIVNILKEKEMVDLMQGVRDLLKANLFSNDLVLPDFYGEELEGSIFFIAWTDEPGARIVEQRILNKMQYSEELKIYGFQPLLNHTVLKIPGDSKGAEQICDDLSLLIEETLRGQIFLRPK